MSVLQIFTELDRMPNNPDSTWIREEAERFVRVGNVTINVFACPKFNTAALAVGDIVGYMPENAVDVDDLFLQRERKIRTLMQNLKDVGLVPSLKVCIGDNDAEEYIFPYMGVDFEQVSAEYSRKQLAYARSFNTRLEMSFPGFSVEAISLGRMKVRASPRKLSLGKSLIKQERKFFEWLFGKDGPYKGKLEFTGSELQAMATKKFQLYGAQGKLLRQYGGILLQTEGPGVWLLRTKMLRCTGSKAIPVIYPWIRTQELRDYR